MAGATEFARDELDKALEAITAAGLALSGLIGLWVLIWEGPTTDGEPVVVLRVAAEQLALGRRHGACTAGRSWWVPRSRRTSGSRPGPPR